MNKFLKIAIVVVLCLIVILTITLFACQKPDNNGSTTTTTTTTTTTNNSNPPEGPTCTEHVDANEDRKCDNCGADIEDPVTPPECTEHVDDNGDYLCDNCNAELDRPLPPSDGEFTEVDDTVYVISIKLNVRTSPELKDDNKVEKLSANYADSFNRTGYNSEWTRIKVDGVDYYVKSDYVSTNKPTTVFDQNVGRETVYIVNVASSIYIRSTTNLDFSENRLTSLSLGDSLVRLGVASEADAEGIYWAKVEVTFKDGNTAIGYVNNKYLATSPNGNANSDMGIKFENNNDILKVIAENSLNLRKYPIYKEGEADDVEKISVPNGTILQRIGLASEADDEGIVWSKVIYNNEIYYVSSNPKYIAIETPGELENKVFTFFGNKVDITLPANFVVMSEGDSYLLSTYDGLTSVTVSYGSNTMLSEEQFVMALIDGLGLTGKAVPTIYNGVVYFDFVTDATAEDGSKISVYSIVAVVESDRHSYYTFSFNSIGTKDDLQATYFEYMDSIRLVSAN